jgi:hypothetical protein
MQILMLLVARWPALGHNIVPKYTEGALLYSLISDAVEMAEQFIIFLLILTESNSPEDLLFALPPQY